MPLKLQHDEMPTLNLTSMIDVLFLLIIFFMVATKFDEMERNIEVAVPQVAAGRRRHAAAAAAGRHRDGRRPHRPRRQSGDGNELTSRLAAARTPLTEPTVVIHGDAKCPFQHVAAALGACRQAGISELGITVRIAGANNTSNTKR